jgi:CheY-like chemotaxis protein
VSVARVLVVDDFAGFRDVIGSMLNDRRDLLVVAEASDGLDAVRKAEELQPGLIVLDLRMPKLNGLEATRRIRTLSPKSKIIIASLNPLLILCKKLFAQARRGTSVLQGKRWFVEPMDDIC